MGPAVHFDCHMMVARPEQWIQPIAEAAGADNTTYTFHLEATGAPWRGGERERESD